eukprot:4851402-Pleurochrysis_carterae.AAC.1
MAGLHVMLNLKTGRAAWLHEWALTFAAGLVFDACSCCGLPGCGTASVEAPCAAKSLLRRATPANAHICSSRSSARQ